MLPQLAVPLALARAHWKLAVLGLLLALVAVQTIRHQRAANRADGAEFHLREAREAIIEQRETYERAQADAQAKNRAEVERIKSDQQEVTNEVTRNLNSRLERLRRELQQKAPAAGGHSQSPGTGPDGKPRPGTDETARVCLTPEELLRGAENEERHDQLIDWVERQLAIPR